MSVERTFEVWNVRCVDKWPKYYGEDVTSAEAEELDAIRDTIVTVESDEAIMALYLRGIKILNDVLIRQFQRKNPDIQIISHGLKWRCDIGDEICKSEVGNELPFGFTEIKFREREHDRRRLPSLRRV